MGVCGCVDGRTDDGGSSNRAVGGRVKVTQSYKEGWPGRDARAAGPTFVGGQGQARQGKAKQAEAGPLEQAKQAVDASPLAGP